MEEHGKKYEYDPRFKGPLQKRSCTDVTCLIIFFIFVLLWMFVGHYALTKGDIEKLIYPTSSDGRKCGIDSEVKNMPHLMFFNLHECVSLTNCHIHSVCREKCPDKNFIYIRLGGQLPQMKSKLICKLGVNLTAVTTWEQMDTLIKNNKCAKWYLKSVPVLNRCLPLGVWDKYKNATMTEAQLAVAKKVIEVFAEMQRYVKIFLEDVKTTWCTVIAFIVASGVMAIIHIFLLKCLALPFIYACILAVCAFLSFGIYELNKQYTLTQTTVSLTGLIICCVLLAIVVLFTLFLRKRIYLACQLIKESSSAVTSILSTLIFPIFPWVTQVAVVVFAVVVALYLTTVGKPYYQVEIMVHDECRCPDYLGYVDNAQCDPAYFYQQCKEEIGGNMTSCTSAGCHLVNFTRPWYITFMQGINAFGLFWMFFFVSALGQMILASTFATWYWTLRKENVPFFTLTKSIWRTFRYHLGTVALGALVITICNVIRILLTWLQKQLKSYGNNRFAQGCISCCKGSFWLLERFLKYINRKAYIMCAVHGTSFFASARDAFNLLIRNVIRVFVLTHITEWLLILGKLYITCLAAFVTWLFYEKYHIQPVNSWAVPVTLVVIGSYLVTSVFFTVYSAAVDTLFMCFLEDCERNDGSESRPYYMSKRLRSLLHR